MRELFIYYRLQRFDATAWQAQVLAAQSELQRRHAGLQTRLLRRPESDEVWDTWMETYARPETPHGVSKELQAEIESVLRPLADALPSASPTTPSTRHTEVFTPCA